MNSSKVREAMEVLTAANSGVGPKGATMDDLMEAWAGGHPYGDDAHYDTCQHVYRLLEEALATTDEYAHLRGIIARARAEFFRDGPDGERCAAMLKVLDEE